MVRSEELKSLKEWYLNYVGSFHPESALQKTNNRVKVDHTWMVCRLARDIGESAGLTEGKRNTAEACALLHDVGRFEQFKRYSTFSDRKSVDHGDLGAKILMDNRVLADLSNETAGIILFTVRNHNKKTIPDDGTKEQLFYTRLLRDADKVDIFRVSLETYLDKKPLNPAVIYELPMGGDVSDEVYTDLMNRRIVDMNHLRTESDFKLLQAGWVFDVNFPRTFEIIAEKKYIDTLFTVLPDSEKIREIRAVIRAHVNEKTEKKNTRGQSRAV